MVVVSPIAEELVLIPPQIMVEMNVMGLQPTRWTVINSHVQFMGDLVNGVHLKSAQNLVPEV